MSLQFVNIQRFDFGALRDFSRPAEDFIADANPVKEVEAAPPPPPPPPPTYTVEQLEKERQSAYQQGLENGIKEGMEKARKTDADRDAALTTLLQQWNQLIETFRTDYRTLVADKQQEVTALSYQIARTVAQKALKEDSTALIEALVKDCLPYLLAEPVLNLTIHPDNAAKMKEWFAKLSLEMHYDGMLRVVEDAHMGVTDGRLNWTNGDAETKQEHIWQLVRQRLHLAEDDSALAASPEITQDTTQLTPPEHPME